MRLVVDDPVSSPLATSTRGVVTVAEALRGFVHGCGAEQVFYIHHPDQYRLERLVVPDEVARHFEICDVKVGKNSQLLTAGALPAQVFSTKARGVSMRTEVASHDRPVSVRVRNISVRAADFEAGAVLRSPRWRGGDHLVPAGTHELGPGKKASFISRLLVGGRLSRLIVTGSYVAVVVDMVEVYRRGVRVAHFPEAGRDVSEAAAKYSESSPGKLEFTRKFFVRPGDVLTVVLRNCFGKSVCVGGAWVVTPTKREGGRTCKTSCLSG